MTQENALPQIPPHDDGIVRLRRSSLRLFAEIVRDPLSTIPPACFDERMVLTRNMGRIRAYVSDPALVHEALVTRADCLEKSESTRRVLGAALGDGLLTADGATWRWQRQAIAPAFQHERLLQLAPAMIAAAERGRDRMLGEAKGDGSVDISGGLMRITFEIISQTMLAGLGVPEASRLSAALDDLLAATPWMFALAVAKAPHFTPFPGRRRGFAAAAYMRATVKAAVAQRRREYAADAAVGSLVDLLLAARDPASGQGLDDTLLTDNILTFFLAGHETTTVALAWTLALLAERPELGATLRAEIDEVVGDAPLEAHQIDALVFTRQVINEAMRLYPPAPIIVRTVSRSFTLGGTDLPAGALVIVPIYAIHHHRRIWPEPERFAPERFAPANARTRHRFAFLPFGAGPRVCVGNTFALLEAAAILAVLVRDLDFASSVPLPRPVMRVTLRPRASIRLQVRERKAQKQSAVLLPA